MIHFFVTFGDNPSESPLGEALRDSGVPHRLFGERVALRYRARIALLLLGWPRMVLFAVRSAWRSLVRSVPAPDTVVLTSHIEVVVFGLAKALLRRRLLRIVLAGFIYTQRRQAWLNALRRRYFALVFRLADVAVCYSALEADQCRRLFGATGARFESMNYGLHVSGRDEAIASAADPTPYIVSAGRSGRDYRTLLEAVQGLDVRLHIVCDNAAALEGLQWPDNVNVLRDCYGDAYIRQLAGALIVVIPLAVDDISAGQMVMIQAMAFGRPVVVSRTLTVEEYVRDGVEVLLVAPRDPAALREAIARLLDDRALREKMGAEGGRAYDSRFSIGAFVQQLLRIV